MAEKRTPEIRFIGFEDEWVTKKFTDAFDMLSNNTLSRDALNLEEGMAKNIHYGDVLTKFGEYLDVSKEKLPFIDDPSVAAKFTRSFLREGDIVIADTAEDETVGKCTEVIGIEDIPVVAGLHTMPCRPKEKYAQKYMGYYINSHAYHDRLLPLMQGVKVTSISRTGVKGTEVILSTEYREQEKIGDHLSFLNEMIALEAVKYEKLKILKKSMLERMFPKGDATVPEIRFAGFRGEWEKRKLGKICERVTRKNRNLESELPLTISAQYGLIDQTMFFKSQIASRDVSNYFLIKKGEFAYNKSYSDGYPFGVIKRLERYEMGVLSILYIIFVPDNEMINSDYLVSYYETNNWHRQVSERAAEGARNHGLLNISAEAFLDTELIYPSKPEEQKKIGLYFQKLDSLITLNRHKLEKLKNIKAACLEKMFV